MKLEELVEEYFHVDEHDIICTSKEDFINKSQIIFSLVNYYKSESIYSSRLYYLVIGILIGIMLTFFMLTFLI